MKKLSIVFLLFLSYLATAQEKDVQYILFDKNELYKNISDSIELFNTFVEIQDKNKKHPNQTIYNYYFVTKNNIPENSNNHLIFESFKSSRANVNTVPYDIIVSITPLTKSLKNELDITSEVKEGAINFTNPKDLLKLAITDIFYGVYAPSGMLDTIYQNNTKRLDLKIVIKEKDRYVLLNQTTLSEFYYISNQPKLYPTDANCCGLFLLSPSVNKSKFLQKENKINSPYRPIHEVVFKDSIIGDLPEYGSYRMKSKIDNIPWVFNFWNVPKKSSILINKGFFDLNTGIGDFSVIEGIGIVNGSFYDFFSDTKNVHLEFNLIFEPKTINEIPYGEFIADFYRNRIQLLQTKWREEDEKNKEYYKERVRLEDVNLRREEQKRRIERLKELIEKRD